MRKTKRITIILTILFGISLNLDFSFASTIMECLGKEELILHKAKMTGPSYKLNQLFIDKFTGFGELEIKKVYLKKICKVPKWIRYTNGVSYKLLKSLLTNGDKIFNFNKIVGPSGTVSFRVSTIKNFSNKVSIHIFFDYLSTLEALMKRPKCLESSIPEIKYFRDRLKYLEGDYPIKKLISEKNKLKNLLRKLENFQKISKICL